MKSGVDPKTVVCEFFKKGLCTKGSKCKFSHDWSGGKKVAKIDVYTDPREQKSKNAGLDAVASEADAKGGVGAQSKIVCWHFLQALEDKKYGFFWKCPNGDDCKYRHSLPPGYVLKAKDEKRTQNEEDEDEISLDEKIEEERAAMVAAGKAVTLCTFANFLAWKEKKKIAKEQELEALRKAAEQKGGKATLSNLSGRDLFSFDPSLFIDDEGADDELYVIEEKPEEEEQAIAEDALYSLEDQEAPAEDVIVSVGQEFDESLFLAKSSADTIDEEDEDGNDASDVELEKKH